MNVNALPTVELAGDRLPPPSATTRPDTLISSDHKAGAVFRALDTRDGTGHSGAVGPNGTISLQVTGVDGVWRGRAERVRDQPRGMGQRDLDLLAGDRVQPAEHAVGGLRAVRQRRHAELQQCLLDEVLVRPRDELV